MLLQPLLPKKRMGALCLPQPFRQWIMEKFRPRSEACVCWGGFLGLCGWSGEAGRVEIRLAQCGAGALARVSILLELLSETGELFS
jgi:hypothetical protein